MLPNKSNRHSGSFYSQWEASLSQIRTDWPRNSKGILRVFCSKAFSEYGFDNPTVFEELKKTTTQVIYDTVEPKLKALAFPDEVIFITQELAKTYTHNFPVELFSVFCQHSYAFQTMVVPFSYHSFSVHEESTIKDYLDWRKQQWLNRHKNLKLKLPKDSQCYIQL
jgi:hypothetical protein